jgi:ribosome-binding factor A
MSHRKEQVESTLQRAVSEVLMRRISDPRIEGMVSVTRVRVSDDFKNADVYVSVLPDKYEKRTLAGLRAAAGHIYGHVMKAMAIRTVPRLDFQLDTELKKEEAIFDAIAKGLDREGLDASQVTHNTEGTPVEAEDDDLEVQDTDDAVAEEDDVIDEADDLVDDDDSLVSTADDDEEDNKSSEA